MNPYTLRSVTPRALACAIILTLTSQSLVADPADLIFGPAINTQPQLPSPIDTNQQQFAENQPINAGEQSSAPAPHDPKSSESKPLPAIEQQPLGTPQTPGQPINNPQSQMLVVGQTVGALLLVISLALGLRFALRSISKRTGSVAGQLSAGGRSPSGLLSILGRYPVARGQTLILLKLDRRILLLCQTPTGFTTLTNIDDPDEVASILTRTEDAQGASMTKKFREALHIAEQDPAVSGNGTLELPDDGFSLNPNSMPIDDARTRVAMDPVASLKRRLEQLGGTSA